MATQIRLYALLSLLAIYIRSSVGIAPMTTPFSLNFSPPPLVSGGVVVKALRYKPAGRGFDCRWCDWNFSVT